MKTVAAIIFILFIGTFAQAQDNAPEVHVASTEMTPAAETTVELPSVDQNKVARLYRFKNSRVKKELAFATKRDQAKAA